MIVSHMTDPSSSLNIRRGHWAQYLSTTKCPFLLLYTPNFQTPPAISLFFLPDPPENRKDSGATFLGQLPFQRQIAPTPVPLRTGEKESQRLLPGVEKPGLQTGTSRHLGTRFLGEGYCWGWKKRGEDVSQGKTQGSQYFFMIVDSEIKNTRILI